MLGHSMVARGKVEVTAEQQNLTPETKTPSFRRARAFFPNLLFSVPPVNTDADLTASRVHPPGLLVEY